jgi:hypothetical protein
LARHGLDAVFQSGLGYCLAKDYVMKVETRNPVWNEDGTIECELNHPHLGWIPFTASENDVEEHGRAIFNAIKDKAVQP